MASHVEPPTAPTSVVVTVTLPSHLAESVRRWQLEHGLASTEAAVVAMLRESACEAEPSESASRQQLINELSQGVAALERGDVVRYASVDAAAADIRSFGRQLQQRSASQPRG